MDQIASDAIKKVMEEIVFKNQPDYKLIGFLIEVLSEENALNRAKRDFVEENLASAIEKWDLFDDYRLWITSEGVEEKYIKKWDLLLSRASARFYFLRQMKTLEGRQDGVCVVFHPGVHSRCNFPFQIKKIEDALLEPNIFDLPHKFLECNCSVHLVSKNVVKIRFPEWHKKLFSE